MAVSQCQTETVFEYSWLQVVQAYWHRYPNPSSTHVLTEDTIKREVRDGKLYTRRLLSKTNPVPKWGERFYKNTPVKILEDSVLDLKSKTLITFTRNIGFKKIMKVDEIVEYKVQDDGHTLAVRRAYITSQVFGFSRAIRALGVERFKSNCNKAANGFNYVLQRMFPNQELQNQPNTAPMNASSTNVANENSLVRTESSTSHANGKLDTLKNATKSSFGFIKNQTIKVAIKAAQLFSVKN